MAIAKPESKSVRWQATCVTMLGQELKLMQVCIIDALIVTSGSCLGVSG